MAPKPVHLRNYVRGAEAARRMRMRMEKMGATFAGQPLWTDAEVETCRLLYPDYKAIKRRLRRRSLIAIQRKCNELGLVPERLAWTGADIAKLRRTYPSASISELLAAFPGRSLRAIKYAANSRGIFRIKKPYVRTGHPPLDQLRDHCRREGFIMRDLDAYARSSNYFQKQGWRNSNFGDRHLARAVAALGGKLVVEWSEEND